MLSALSISCRIWSSGYSVPRDSTKTESCWCTVATCWVVPLSQTADENLVMKKLSTFLSRAHESNIITKGQRARWRDWVRFRTFISASVLISEYHSFLNSVRKNSATELQIYKKKILQLQGKISFMFFLSKSSYIYIFF